VISDTLAGRVLNNREVQEELLSAVVKHPDSVRVLLNGRSNGKSREAYGPDQLSIWDEISKRLVENFSHRKGDIIAFVPQADITRVFGRTEMRAYLEQPTAGPMNNQPHSFGKKLYNNLRKHHPTTTTEQAAIEVADFVTFLAPATLGQFIVHYQPDDTTLVDPSIWEGHTPAPTPPHTIATTTLEHCTQHRHYNDIMTANPATADCQKAIDTELGKRSPMVKGFYIAVEELELNHRSQPDHVAHAITESKVWRDRHGQVTGLQVPTSLDPAGKPQFAPPTNPDWVRSQTLADYATDPLDPKLRHIRAMVAATKPTPGVIRPTTAPSTSPTIRPGITTPAARAHRGR
jgi:hypothetical protein